MIKIDLNNMEHVYALGYFWADCCFGIRYKQSKMRKDPTRLRNFAFEIKTSDFVDVWQILQSMGFKKFSTRTRSNSLNSQSSTRAATYNELEFFETMQFHNKYNGCPLYFFLSQDAKIFFVKGFLDGDGTICERKPAKRDIISGKRPLNFCVCFYGKHSQSWDFLEDFCSKNNIRFSIYNSSRKSHHASHTKSIHQYSTFNIAGCRSMFSFCELLANKNIGVKRKIQNFFDVKAKYPNLVDQYSNEQQILDQSCQQLNSSASLANEDLNCRNKDHPLAKLPS